MTRSLATLTLLCTALAGGCTAPTPVAFRITDADGSAVAGAHARIILLDAGVPLPVRAGSLEEAGMTQADGGDFSDANGMVELPVAGTREHLIEVEGPVLGVPDPRGAPVGVWVYRPGDGSLTQRGEDAVPLRIERVD